MKVLGVRVSGFQGFGFRVRDHWLWGLGFRVKGLVTLNPKPVGPATARSHEQRACRYPHRRCLAALTQDLTLGPLEEFGG